MAEEQKSESPQQREEKAWVFPKDGRPEIYSNLFYIHWTLYDLRIRFGMVIPNPALAPTKATIEIQEVGAVVMSWDQAKYMRDALAGAVKAYEEVNGEIKPKTLPKG
jgi:Protein of unknown function (DUF3467)